MFLMRRNMLETCALENVTWVGDRCKTVPESSCSNKKTCDVRVFGLVFPDDLCFVMINNRASSLVATVQVNNFYDRPRYYGTCFVLIFTIAGGLAILANVGWQFYTIIIAPVGKHTAQVQVKLEQAQADPERAAATAVAPSAPAAPGKAGLYEKLIGHLRSSRDVKHHA
ncbi:hypothetical protein GPECTOR_3g387 [Gonium pectorale]|uniref:Uncharacterized protein n=1 Tax=Gonium pectorale TaxID=33097 RepID=A0A150GZA4_GONPE|nr:hypothetical protein GPECTOR_3g387 [Gonium pectorale]|eukprot:KXZ55247.1 hypothetical protein GPECTOR_3g387 [Gonium pectorale]